MKKFIAKKRTSNELKNKITISLYWWFLLGIHPKLQNYMPEARGSLEQLFKSENEPYKIKIPGGTVEVNSYCKNTGETFYYGLNVTRLPRSKYGSLKDSEGARLLKKIQTEKHLEN